MSEGVADSLALLQDTTTVDTNVSRHLGALLADPPNPPSRFPLPSAFDAVILHFLGMDHVGHLGGANRSAHQSHILVASGRS